MTICQSLSQCDNDKKLSQHNYLSLLDLRHNHRTQIILTRLVVFCMRPVTKWHFFSTSSIYRRLSLLPFLTRQTSQRLWTSRACNWCSPSVEIQTGPCQGQNTGQTASASRW